MIYSRSTAFSYGTHGPPYTTRIQQRSISLLSLRNFFRSCAVIVLVSTGTHLMYISLKGPWDGRENAMIYKEQMQTKYSDIIKRCHMISSSEYQSPYENCSTCTFIKGRIFLFYYDERKERLRYLLLHILFFLEAFAIHLHAIFLPKIISVIIAIYSIASNEEFCITIIQLLQVWISLVLAGVAGVWKGIEGEF